jgi:homoserine kinase
VPLPLRADAVRVRVPATSANLGPGYDSAGLALTLHDDVVVRVTHRGLRVDVTGEGAGELPRNERHLVVKALRTAFDALGGQPPGVHLSCANRIPQSRGLGSSSAAICAALVAARALVEGGERLLDDDALLALATRLEGHPDNVAACLRGGATFAWTEDTGRVGVVRVEPAPDLAPVAFVPATRASTARVRGMLPAQVPHADAAANSGRAALLPLALTGAVELLHAATRDLLHQAYRAPAMPETAALVDALRAEGLPAVVSGAGPTVLALTTTAQVPDAARRAPGGWTALPLQVERSGAVAVVSPGSP